MNAPEPLRPGQAEGYRAVENAFGIHGDVALRLQLRFAVGEHDTSMSRADSGACSPARPESSARGGTDRSAATLPSSDG